MIFNSVDILGYLALLTNLTSMNMKELKLLRILAAAANALYVIYGILIGAMPVAIGCTIAVGIHLYRLKKELKLKRSHCCNN